MAVKRIVNTKFWEDETVLDTYSVEDKYFLLYLMTNTKTTQLGIYQLPKKLMSFQTGYTNEVIEVLIQRFNNKYKNIVYSHETQEIAVLNSLKYSIVKGGKPVSDLLTRELSAVKDVNLIKATYDHMLDWWNNSTRPFDLTVKNLLEEELVKRNETLQFFNDNDNDNDNEDSYHESYHESSEIRQSDKDTIPYLEILKYLNDKADKNFRAVEGNKKFIRARFNEGYTLEEFKKVIDNKTFDWKDTSWKDTQGITRNGNDYLRPSTLFGNKFDNYLNEERADSKVNNDHLINKGTTLV